MKIFSKFLFLILLCLIGCQNETDEGNVPKEPVPGYLELLEAHSAEKVFSKVLRGSDADVVIFEDGTRVTVPLTSFLIHDCTKDEPADVKVAGQWWSIDDKVYGIMVDMTLPDAQAQPVYVYYDRRGLYMKLSNTHLLTFTTLYNEEEKLSEQEIARQQNIPVIYIDTKGVEILDKENYVEGTITIKDPEKLYSDVTEFSAKMGIRGRGNSTWSFPKKPWKVKLKEKAQLLGMPADKEWALLANYSDRTLLRNVVAMELSRICGFSWTPRMVSVEVYLNNRYQGVYNLCEHKKISEDRVNIDIVGEGDNSGEAITGGYYLEIEQQQDETTCWWTKMGAPMMFSDPEVPTPEQLEYVKGYIDDFETALKNRDFSEETGYLKYIDLTSFLNYYIVQELTKNIDGDLRKSTFLTKERGKKMEMYHLWDFDLTLGNAGYFDPSVGDSTYRGYWIKKSSWYRYMFNDPAFVDALQARWNELYPELDRIPEFIDRQALFLDKAKDRNFEVWDIKASVDWVNMPSKGSYEKELQYLKEFYINRLEWLNTELMKL
ncbi:MAG: CotH kinase family protein [Bacteroidales bacterium]|nr:CotH kinase family protein [Bacteroidales bacterium]